MQALLFLTTRSFLNGVKRALTSGRRLFTLLFGLLYYAFLVFRPLSHRNDEFSSSVHPVAMLSGQAVDVSVFAFFGALSLMLMLSIATPRGSFRQPDVDVLFATPVSPRLLMYFRMIRDYVFTLLTPLIFMLFGGRGSLVALQGFVAGVHRSGGFVGRVASASWFLMALSWTCIGYGIGFLVNRSDLQSDINKKRLSYSIFGICMVTMLYFVICLRNDLSWDTAMNCAQSLWVRSVFFTATAATWMVVGALNGNVLMIAGGALLLIGLATGGVYIAESQLAFMYDQAAVRGFDSTNLRTMRRNNDIYGLSAQQARDGKVKVGRFSRWIGRIRLMGASALVWKEVLLQVRGARMLYFFLGPIQLVLTLSPILALSGSDSPTSIRGAGMVIMAMQCVSVLILTMNSAVSGYTELLKRVDFQKPLPFRPSGTVFWEVASKCIPNVLFSGISVVLLLILRPVLWDYAIASFVFVVGLSLLLSATVFLITIAFPDAGDASQRGFRGILVLLAIVIFGSPGVGTFILLTSVLNLNPALSVIPSTLISFGITVAVTFVSGGLYDSYNPSE
ncbi:MAG: putative ABC exporter domain-containing protein [Fimbriimonas sp.]|nr:putative ABC exporter domain-containing protein [Fimbriimonas sp.]